MNTPVSQALAPDFYHYESSPLAAAITEGDFVHLRWPCLLYTSDAADE